MEERIKKRFNQAILQEAMERYNIAANHIRQLGGFESFIYEFRLGSREYILRISHSLRRNKNLIHGEVDWINYLANGGASVAKAIESKNGNLVELIDDSYSGQFLTTAFVKAKGQSPYAVGWNPQIFETYGKLLGKIHKLTKQYKLSNPDWKRPEWDDPIMQDIERHLPPGEEVISKKYSELMEHFNSLPRDRESYGLIHYDAHGGNLFIDEAGNITLFDFDDCAYGWFAYDIAMVLFYIVIGRQDIPGFTHEFMQCFLKGYSKENKLNPIWLSEIPNFLKHREIDLYALIHRSFDINNIKDQWCARYMYGRREKIENDVPYIDYSFNLLSEYL